MKLRLRQAIYIILAIAAFVLLIVVVTNSQSPESLMVPPEAAGDYKDIQDVIKDNVHSGIILKAPNEGEYTTAITFADINLDGANDAVAFYRLKNDDTSSIYMSVLLRNGTKWFASEAVKGKGNDVLEFSYGDLNYDSVPEIVVGWSMFDSKDNNSLCVYSVDTENKAPGLQLDDSVIYTKMFVDDICREGKKEILVVKNTYNNEAAPAKATLFELIDNQLKALSEVEMLNKVSEYKKIQTQTVASKDVFYLDGVIDKENMITEILYWDEQTKAMVNAASVLPEAGLAVRKGVLTASDINGDGIIEIPFNEPDEEFSITLWKQFEFDGFRTVCQGVSDEELIFVFPQQWNNQIRYTKEGNIFTFYDVSGEESVKLFELISCDIATWKNFNSEYEQLKIDYGTIYGVKFISNRSELVLNKNEIKQAINNIR